MYVWCLVIPFLIAALAGAIHAGPGLQYDRQPRRNDDYHQVREISSDSDALTVVVSSLRGAL